MTLHKDDKMSGYERLMLGGAVGVIVAYVIFFMFMTDGWALGQRDTLFLAIAIIGFEIIVAVGLGISLIGRYPKRKILPDEREEILDVSANGFGYYALEAALFFMLLLALLQSAFGDQFLGSYALNRPEAIVFWLITASALAGLARLLGAWGLARHA
jgi:hypothetical protein